MSGARQKMNEMGCAIGRSQGPAVQRPQKVVAVESNEGEGGEYGKVSELGAQTTPLIIALHPRPKARHGP